MRELFLRSLHSSFTQVSSCTGDLNAPYKSVAMNGLKLYDEED